MAIHTPESEASSIGSRSREGLLTASSFRQTCGFCGCVFQVEVTWRTSYSYKPDQDTQKYSCPECRRDCRIKTSTPPQVTLISGRTDGRAGFCPQK